MVAADCHDVNTTSGLVKGFETKSGDIYVYKNVPYAKPPVGDLRFELPEQLDTLQEVKSSLSPIYCPQHSSHYTRIKNSTFGQEDCLYLDIYASKTKTSQSLPVLIYFHPGRFSYGSKEEFRGDFLLNYNEIIVVIPNYRLGILGFLRGNLGLFDQRMAMQWVWENIPSFGGDRGRITIAGHDAGGAAVGLHVLSARSHDSGVDDPFLSSSPQKLYEEGRQKNVSYLIGISKDEAFVEVETEFPTAVKTQHLDMIIQHFLKPYLLNSPNLQHTVTAVKYHYLRGVPVPAFESIIPQMIRMLSDYLYNTPAQISLKLHGQKASNTFMYVFSDKNRAKSPNYYTSFEYTKNHLGRIHLGDAPYVFKTSFLEDLKVSNHRTKSLCSIWGEFIKKNALSIYNWKKFNKEEMNYMDISETVTSQVDYRKKDIELWTVLIPELQNIVENLSTVAPQRVFLEPNSAAWGAAGLSVLLGVLCVALIGVVVVTRKELTQSSIIPINSNTYKDQVKYNNIELE
ncbi:hypothetical protein JTE90_016110 [Oedothorax gibbosus]|uniref:Carboxylesterase type B domain-containing protein n=1 Tax=Oedothorax gibbosus TaxID=931172 RepID=A0AAV6U3D8_9ARAC|nr:hypothetical protein JTE90_016110 [Oedothorax gibbosus]